MVSNRLILNLKEKILFLYWKYSILFNYIKKTKIVMIYIYIIILFMSKKLKIFYAKYNNI